MDCTSIMLDCGALFAGYGHLMGMCGHTLTPLVQTQESRTHNTYPTGRHKRGTLGRWRRVKKGCWRKHHSLQVKRVQNTVLEFLSRSWLNRESKRTVSAVEMAVQQGNTAITALFVQHGALPSANIQEMTDAMQESSLSQQHQPSQRSGGCKCSHQGRTSNKKTATTPASGNKVCAFPNCSLHQCTTPSPPSAAPPKRKH